MPPPALRFLQGFFGNPCLANGGATVGDKTKGSTVIKHLSIPTSTVSLFGTSPHRGQQHAGPEVAGFAVFG